MPDLLEADRIQREVFLKSMVPSARHTFWATSRIAEAMEDVVARAGDVVYEAGTPAEHYYFVVDGQIEMVRPGAFSVAVAPSAHFRVRPDEVLRTEVEGLLGPGSLILARTNGATA